MISKDKRREMKDVTRIRTKAVILMQLQVPPVPVTTKEVVTGGTAFHR